MHILLYFIFYSLYLIFYSFYFMYTSLVLYFSIFALSMERTRLSFHCWLYNLCIVVYVTNKTWNLKQDNAKPHSAHITKSWLRRKRVRVLDWPACSPDLSPIENVWRILKRKMRQRRPRTVAHLKTCLQEEWDKITPETLHHLVSSVPKRLLSVVKRNGNITKW